MVLSRESFYGAGVNLRTGLKQRVDTFLHGNKEPNRLFIGGISDQLDNGLLHEVSTINRAMEHLGNPDVHPTTKRELVHRLTKAVVTEATRKGIERATLQEVSAVAGEFYGSVYWGLQPHSIVEYSPAVTHAIGELPIDNGDNRNFGAPFWEGIIRTRLLEEAEILKRETDLENVVIVPVASGGLEPGIALRELLHVPDFWVKPFKDDNVTIPLGDPHELHEKDLVLIEDRIRTGASLGLAKQFVEGFDPRSVKTIIIQK